MANFDLGRVVPLYRGVYASGTTYELNDVVTLGGSLYWHKADTSTTGTAPTDTDTWVEVLSLDDAEAFVARAEAAADEAEDWATGGSSGTPTATNNAKYYSEQAASSASDASTAETGAQTAMLEAARWASGNTPGTPSSSNNAKKYAEDAAASAAVSEGWATGGTGGTSSAANNAKYYSEQSAASAAASAASAASVPATQSMIAPREASSTATRNYSVGDLVIIGDVLYRVTAAIASGETITAGTNVTADTVSAELAELDDEKADKDGTILNAENAEQIVTDMRVTNKVPYTFRTAGGGAEIGDRAFIDKIVGGTVAWNQLASSGAVSVSVPAGHISAARISGTWSISQSDGAAVSVTGGTDMIFDLTQMFGATIADYIAALETANTGAGIAWFKSLFPADYYAYDAGTLRSVNAAAHKTVGFNAFDASTADDGHVYSLDGRRQSNTSGSCQMIRVIPNTTYYIKSPRTANFYNIVYFDAEGNGLNDGARVAANGTGKTFTTPAECGYVGVNTLTADKGIVCLNLSWDGERDGGYEPYSAHTYALDDTLTLRGIPKLDANNALYYDGDEYAPDGTVTRRYGTRAYEAGDEALTGSITDGTNTVYELTTPTTEAAAPYTSPQIVDNFGTEEYTDAGVAAGTRDVAIPVGHVTEYPQNLRAKLEAAPDSPDADGDYIMRRTGGTNGYAVLTRELPSVPGEDGTYRLVCTVSGGEAAYSWEAVT